MVISHDTGCDSVFLFRHRLVSLNIVFQSMWPVIQNISKLFRLNFG